MMILIEGTDLVGKSTTARNVVASLRARGRQVSHKKGALYEHFLHRQLRRFPPWEYPMSGALSLAYCLSAVVESVALRAGLSADYSACRRGELVIVCESHHDRAQAFARALGLGALVRLVHAVTARLSVRFDRAVLLTASLRTRRSRLERRPPGERNLIDELTSRDQVTHDRLNEELAASMRRHRRTTVVDTDGASPAAVAAEVVSDISYLGSP